MKNYELIKFLILFLNIWHFQTGHAQLLSFPGAEGFGAFAKGGRGGKVIFVDNLNDSGPGSLRAAVEDTIPRTVIFNISGIVELKSDLLITSPCITLAGQTAPGDGICLKNFALKIRGTHDVIVRFIRIRPGIEFHEKGNSTDAIEIRDSENIIIDHCSASWGTDELLNTWHGTKDITVQWSIFSEPLNKSIHKKGAHGYAASIGGVRNSFHYNLFANAAGRNPSIAGQDNNKTISLNFCNNVIFNWQQRSCDGKPVSINFEGNYYKPGPSTWENMKKTLVKLQNCDEYGFSPKWYIEKNIIEGFPESLADNWGNAVMYEPGTSEKLNRSRETFQNGGYIVKSPESIYNVVLENVGAVSPKRDKIDSRIIAEVKSGRTTFGDGIIDKVEQVGGWPELQTAAPLTDSDRDGIPDNWEHKNGLNPYDPTDRNSVSEENGYTQLENYLNELPKINKQKMHDE